MYTPHDYEAEVETRLPLEITKEDWWYALEVLPPMAYTSQPGWESFLLSEMQSGPFTHQYVQVTRDGSSRYYQKLVNAFIRSTWMTPDNA